MKLGDFLPDVVNRDAKLVQANQILSKTYENGFANFMKSRVGGSIESSPQHLGIEQLYFEWLRQAYAYRRMFIQDL